MVKAIIPETLNEALTYMNQEKYRIVAGGTDMLIQNHNLKNLAINYRENVIYIAALKELQGIEEDRDSVFIGACEPLEAIMENPMTPKLLRDTIIEMASPAIRNIATLGGNIGNASPAGDSLVPLYLLNATLEIKSLSITRYVDIKEFITGVRKIALADNELISKIIIDKVDFDKAIFKKVGPRLSDAISKLSFAAAYAIEFDKISDIRFAFGAVNTTVVRHPEIECQYIQMSVEEIKQHTEDIIAQYEKYIKPIDDQRSNKEYRKTVSLNLLRDFIDKM